MRKGFTLIELLGVIVILGLIVAVAVPSLIESNKQAQINEEKDFENTLKLATKDYINYYGDSNICEENDQTCIDDANNMEKLYTDDEHEVTIGTDELIRVAFLKKSLVDPKTNKKLENENITITVKNNQGTLEYSYTRP